MAIDYSTTSEVKAALGVEHANDDARIATLITAVSRAIDRYCRRDFAAGQDIQEYPDAEGLDFVAVRRPPISSIDSIFVSESAPRVYDATTQLASDAYVFDDLAGIIYRVDGGMFGRGPQSTAIVYSGGLWTATANVPADVKRAMAEIVQVKLAKAKTQVYHLTSESREGGSIAGIRFDDWPDRARAVLNTYRVFV